jgi:3-methyl-2-oxobutanoate hydroxymethyltransferase
MSQVTKNVTINTLQEYKSRQEKFAVLTAYDASFAAQADEQGVDVILVGDSLGMVIQGKDSTVPVTTEEIIYHTQCVATGCQRALIMADMPFMTYYNKEIALDTAARLMQEGGAHMVKLECHANQIEVVKAIVEQGIPVCAHLGLTPQSVHKLGGYRVQGRDSKAAKRMVNDAVILEQTGADLLLLECVPASLAREITEKLSIPVIGIGAGPDTDAQVLVLYDVIGISKGRIPKFSKNFLADNHSIAAAIGAYVKAVRNNTFPGPEHGFN